MADTKAYRKWNEQERNAFYCALYKQCASGSEKINYHDISRHVQTKTARQCYDFHLINRDRQHSARHMWTLEEKEKLLSYGKLYNKDWARIQAEAFPQLSVSQLRNKFSRLDAQHENSRTEELASICVQYQKLLK